MGNEIAGHSFLLKRLRFKANNPTDTKEEENSRWEREIKTHLLLTAGGVTDGMKFGNTINALKAIHQQD
jgi:hypothetical protein